MRAATCSSLISASELSSSSVSPSEKYSCSLSPLRFTNGSTAIECGGGLKAAAAPGSAVARDAMSPADVLGCRRPRTCRLRGTPAPRRRRRQRSRAVPAVTAGMRAPAPLLPARHRRHGAYGRELWGQQALYPLDESRGRLAAG